MECGRQSENPPQVQPEEAATSNSAMSTEVPPLVSTPFGIGEVPRGAETPEGEAFTHVQFPWGHAYMHSAQVAAAPEFTFYALTKMEHIKFTLPFALTSDGAEMVAAVRRQLDVPDHVAVTLVQTDSVDKHEIKPGKKIGDCTVGAGPLHPVLVLQTPIVRFNRKKCSFYTILQEQDTLAVQIAKGFGSVLGDCEVSRGVKYWEVELKSARGGDGVFVGVAAPDLALNSSVLNRGVFWGLSCATGHKLHETIDYFAEPCKDGDVVGVLLDMEYGRLSFYVNGRYLGVAFSGIQAKRLVPVLSLTFIGQQVRLLPTASPPVA